MGEGNRIAETTAVWYVNMFLGEKGKREHKITTNNNNKIIITYQFQLILLNFLISFQLLLFSFSLVCLTQHFFHFYEACKGKQIMPHNMSHKNYSAIDENRMSIVNKQQKNICIFLHFFFLFYAFFKLLLRQSAHWGRPSQQRGQLFCGLSCRQAWNEGNSTVLECTAAMLHVASKSEIVCMQFHSHFPHGLISSWSFNIFRLIVSTL